MYRMVIDGLPLMDMNDPDLSVDKPTLKYKANKLCTLTFTIYNNNPRYEQIQKLRSLILVYRDDDIIAMVRPIKSKLNFNGGLEYTCEDILGRFNDIMHRPSYFKGTKTGYLDSLLTDYGTRMNGETPTKTIADYIPLKWGDRNEGVRQMQAAIMSLGYDVGVYGADGIFKNYTQGGVKSFQKAEGLTVDGVFKAVDLARLEERIGEITPTEINTVTFKRADTSVLEPYDDGDDQLEFINDEFTGIWDLIQKNLVDEYGGYIVPEYKLETAGGETTLSVVLHYRGDDDLTQNAQSIRFGENLNTLFVDNDTADTFTVLIPLGADVRRQNPQGEQSENTPLTINVDGKDYIEDEDGLALYGRRERTMRWDDIDDAADLLAKAQEYMAENSVYQLKETVSLTATDLRYAGVDIEYLNFLDKVTVVSKLHSVADDYPVTEMQLSLNTPTGSKITIGGEQQTLTDRMLANAANANGGYAALSSRLFRVENPTT